MGIEQNLGNFERVLRLIISVLVGIWALNTPELGMGGWLLVLAGVFLLLNGIFGRCYLWYVLDINTCQDDHGNCKPRAECP
ncbi:YgaP family membrane protein [Halioglobus pacificus]|uniref:Inner membrane protein YgaP-like transmembrane domain-containing protein n=1 Tax=Parahalioglobus pacificus TaxID=930806 RepID=A0A918XGP5_9GAMM|nr:DUF2892 domain-containing protein [Halioglobus pacificus]NQY02837.1 DUF2892 domain-containing protein [Halieaceae bacterium]GHD31505.1 hypothetical protein GCM10007053_14630 [Halioglobus pacificus]